MPAGSDPLGHPQGLTARRSAASNLPNFELPPPPLASLAGKPSASVAAYASHQSASSGSVASVGNLLTPPNTIPGENGSPNPMNVGGNGLQQHWSVPPFNQAFYWGQPMQGPSSPSYGYHSGNTPTQWVSPRGGVFSPSSLNSLMRANSATSVGTDMAPSHPYEVTQLPPFSYSQAVSAPTTLPTMSAPQQNAIASAYANASNSIPNPAANPSPLSAQDGYGAIRPPPSPAYMNGPQSSNTSQQPHAFSYSSNQPQPLASPPDSASQRSRPPSQTNNSDPSLSQPSSAHSPPQYQRPFGQYSLPAMTGHVMPNIHSPTGQMAMVGGLPTQLMGGFNSGHAASMQHIYGVHGGHTHAQQTTNDRPFKCDQCTQSFNRNHDLKRHKRIHLAVKPYPCAHCDKSFSRKDALKRHILVKGCDKEQGTSNADKQSNDGSESSPRSRISSHGQSPPSNARGMKLEQ